jgi:hypothetical protein
MLDAPQGVVRDGIIPDVLFEMKVPVGEFIVGQGKRDGHDRIFWKSRSVMDLSGRPLVNLSRRGRESDSVEFNRGVVDAQKLKGLDHFPPHIVGARGLVNGYLAKGVVS